MCDSDSLNHMDLEFAGLRYSIKAPFSRSLLRTSVYDYT